MSSLVTFDPLPADIQHALDRQADRLGAFARAPRFRWSTGSTNDDAARLAAGGAAEGTWVLAEAQSAGRGRRGRAWASPPGAGLYLSVIFRPPRTASAEVQPQLSPLPAHRAGDGHGHAERSDRTDDQTHAASGSSFGSTPPADPASSLLTLMAGVAVVSGIQAATGLTPALKWPNDVMIEQPLARRAVWRDEPGAPDTPVSGVTGVRVAAGAAGVAGAAGMAGVAATNSRWRKLAGMLAEASASGGSLQAIVLGIGLNLTPAAYPPDVAARATSLEGELGRPIDRADVLVEILAALADWRARLLAGDAAALLDRWRALAPSSHGRRVRWALPAAAAPTGAGTGASAAVADGVRWAAGVTRGIDASGALLVQTSDGIERIIAGEVEWE